MSVISIKEQPALDPAHIIRLSQENNSHLPVTTSRYLLEVVMNEEHPGEEVDHIKRFEEEFQSALDIGYFASLRYNGMEFTVRKREVLHIAEANDPEQPLTE